MSQTNILLEAGTNELEIVERLCAVGLKPDPIELARQFAFPLASDGKSGAANAEKETQDEF